GAVDAKHGADADERESVEEVAFAGEVHLAELAHQAVDDGGRQGVELINEQDERSVKGSSLPREELDPSVPIVGRGGLEREAVPEQGRHGPEEDLLGVRVAEAA